jgi:hypothetical protein
MNMQFVNKTTSNNYFYYIDQNQKLTPSGAYVMPIMRPSISKRTVAVSENTSVIESPPVKKMRWGEPTWFLFHTLAHKIKDEYFYEKKAEILNTISLICSNLPCPNCANHATEYMKSINIYSIQSKQDLKNMLFQFHNVVNQRKGFPLFSINDLDTKYSAANTLNIIKNFMYFFQDKHFSIRMIANDLHRSRITENLKQWFNDNINYFDS